MIVLVCDNTHNFCTPQKNIELRIPTTPYLLPPQAVSQVVSVEGEWQSPVHSMLTKWRTLYSPPEKYGDKLGRLLLILFSHTSTWLHMHTGVHAQTQAHAHRHAHTHTRLFVQAHGHAHTHACLYVHACTHTHTCMHIHACTHTHEHCGTAKLNRLV